MKSNRALFVGIGAVFGLLIGAFLGLSFDDLRAVHPAAEMVGRFSDCFYCADAFLPMLGWWLNANAVTLVGLAAGTGVGAVMGWALAGNLLGAGFSAGPISAAMTITAALSNSLGDEALARRVERLMALTDSALYSTFDTGQILTRAHDVAARLTTAQTVNIIFLDWDRPAREKAIRVGQPIDFPELAPVEEEVLASGRSRIINDFQAEPAAPVATGVRSALLAPIVTTYGKVIGLVGLHSNVPNAFDNELQRLAEALASQAAAALDNARRREELLKHSESLRDRVDQLSHLLHVTRLPHPDRPLAANLEDIALGIQQYAGSSIVAIGAVSLTSNQLERLAVAGLPTATIERFKSVTLSWDAYAGLLRPEYQNGTVYLVPYAKAIELFSPLEIFDSVRTGDADAPDDWRHGGTLLLPVYGAAGEAIGLIQLYNLREGQLPDGTTLEALETLASPAAAALEHARLLAQMRARLVESQERTNRLGALNDAVRVISSASRREAIVDAAVGQLKDVIPYDRVALYLKEKATGQFRVAAIRGRDGEEQPGPEADLLDRTLFTEIEANQCLVAVADVTGDARFQKVSSRNGAWLGVPLLYSKEVVGILGIEKDEKGFYTGFQESLAQAYTNHIALVLEKARQYDEILGSKAELTERIEQPELPRQVFAEFDPANVESIEAGADRATLAEDGSDKDDAEAQFEYEGPQGYTSPRMWVAAQQRTPEPLVETGIASESPKGPAPNVAKRLATPLVIAGLTGVFLIGGLALALALADSLPAESTAIPYPVTDAGTLKVLTSSAAAASTVIGTTARATLAFVTEATAPTGMPSATLESAGAAPIIPTAQASPTPAPTLPPDVIALGTIRVTPGTSARLRATPNGEVVGGVADGEQVQVLLGKESSAGVNWVQVRLKTGQVGWIADTLIETSTSP